MDEQMREKFEAFLKEEAPAIYDASNADARYIWTKAWQACAAALSQPAAQGPLTDAQIDALWTQQVNLPQKVQRRVIARAIEATHGIKATP